MGYKSGFITLIGPPNVGKSTLMNRMIGQKISIEANRAQTTRYRVLGVVSREDYQMIFVDTPGVTAPRDRLGEYMLKVAYDALVEVEAVLLMLDASRGIEEREEDLFSKLRERIGKTPVIAAINKMDLVTEERCAELFERMKREDWISSVFLISASNGQNVDKLESALYDHLVDGPQYFPDDMITDQPIRAICAELIREHTIEQTRYEVPHGIAVSIDRIKLRDDGINDVLATIYCDKPQHKKIIIGNHGKKIKSIGIASRIDMERLLETKVNLELWVKVRPGWRNNMQALKEFGFDDSM